MTQLRDLSWLWFLLVHAHQATLQQHYYRQAYLSALTGGQCPVKMTTFEIAFSLQAVAWFDSRCVSYWGSDKRRFAHEVPVSYGQRLGVMLIGEAGRTTTASRVATDNPCSSLLAPLPLQDQRGTTVTSDAKYISYVGRRLLGRWLTLIAMVNLHWQKNQSMRNADHKKVSSSKKEVIEVS